MAFVYSAEKNAFFSEDLKDVYKESGVWPMKSVSVSDDDYRALMNGHAQGQAIVPDDKGYPVLASHPEPTHEELVRNAEAKKILLMAEAEAIISPLQRAAKYKIATDAEMLLLEQQEVYSVLLSRVDTSKAPDITWPEKPS